MVSARRPSWVPDAAGAVGRGFDGRRYTAATATLVAVRPAVYRILDDLTAGACDHRPGSLQQPSDERVVLWARRSTVASAASLKPLA